MNKVIWFLFQFLLSIIIILFCLIVILTRKENCWERAYKNCDKSVVEIYSLDIGNSSMGVKSGTGFIYNLHEKSIIITNRHLISTMTEIKFQDGIKVTTKILDASELHDLAILKPINVNLKRYGYLSRGLSSNLRIGEQVMTIGHPIFESHHISVGFYTGKFTDKRGRTLLRLSMAVDQGNSGGPLLNKKGQVVGIITLKVPDSANIAYAIPIEKIHQLSY